jgi:hypothetical protein
MNALQCPQLPRLQEASPQEALDLGTEGVQRYVWESRFGAMLIEVVDGIAHINGERVDPIGAEGAANSPGVAR